MDVPSSPNRNHVLVTGGKKSQCDASHATTNQPEQTISGKLQLMAGSKLAAQTRRFQKLISHKHMKELERGKKY